MGFFKKKDKKKSKKAEVANEATEHKMETPHKPNATGRASREALPFESSPGNDPYMGGDSNIADRYYRPFGYGVDENALRKKLKMVTPRKVVTDLAVQSPPVKPDFPDLLKEWDISKALGISDENAVMFSNFFRYVKYSAGETVFTAGSGQNKECFIVYAGELSIEYNESNLGMEISVDSKLTKGSYFGELCLAVEVMPRGYTVRASTDCKLFALSRRALIDFVGTSDALLKSYTTYKANVVAKVLATLDIPFFQSIPQEQLAGLGNILDYAEITEVAPLETFCMAMDPAHTFDFLVSGEAQVRGGPVIKPGQHFGEVALSSVVSRPVTIAATDKPAVFLSFYGADFAACFEGKPQLYANLALQLGQSHSSLTAVLLHPMAKSHFVEFLEKCWNERHVKFCDAVKIFQKLDDANKEKLLAAANKLNDEFVAPNSVDQVNIGGNCREKIQTLLRKASIASEADKERYQKRVTTDLFSEALNEVMGLLSFDFLESFKKTEEFQTLLKAVGTFKYPSTSQLFKNLNGFRLHGTPNDPLGPERITLLGRLR